MAQQTLLGGDGVTGESGATHNSKANSNFTELYAATAAAQADADAANSALSAHVSDATDAHAGSAITFTPVGTISATNVQDAIAEVALEAGSVSVPDASETTKGIAELATQSETNLGSDDARIVTPLKAKVKNRATSTKTGDYTIQQTDDQTVIFVNSATAVVLTFPVLVQDTYVTVINLGAGAVTWTTSSTSFTGPVTNIPGNSNAAVTFWYATTSSIRVIGGSITTVSDLSVSGVLAVKAGASTGNIAKVGGVIYTSTTQTGNITTGDDTLFSYGVPGSTLNTNKESLRMTCAGTFAATANTKRIRAKLGSTTIFDTGALSISAATDWVLEVEIIRTSAINQKCCGRLVTSSSTLPAFADYSAATETLANTLNLIVSGEATATNDIIGEMFKVRYEPNE